MTEDFPTALESSEQKEIELVANEDRVLNGTVLKIGPDYLVVDIGLKSEGVVPLAEVRNHEGNLKFRPGDEVQVKVLKFDRKRQCVYLGFKQLTHDPWLDAAERYPIGAHVKGRVISVTDYGAFIELEQGIEGLCHNSEATDEHGSVAKLEPGQEYDFEIIKMSPAEKKVELSIRAVGEETSRTEGEIAEMRTATIEQLHEDGVLTGVVKNLTDYGAFVDLGGIDGLLHITDMSWGRLTHPRDLVQVGDHIQVKVLKFDKDKQRVSLGFKQLTPDPWLDAAERYPIGAHVKGRVISVTDYGAFIELEQGIEGLVHVREMTWSRRMKHPSKLVGVSDQVEAVVLHVNPQERRISLGFKQLETNPWESLHEKYPVGSIIEGKVLNLTDFGAFIEIEDGIAGMVHVSNLSWTKRLKHPSEVLKKGDTVRATVLAIEPDQQRISLGVTQLQPDVESFVDQHQGCAKMLDAFLNERGLRMPDGLSDVYASPEARSLESYIYWPDRSDANINSLGWALRLLRDAAKPPPDNYVPLLPVDEMSIACLACPPLDVPDNVPGVARWHLGNIHPDFQDSPLDTDVGNYVRSVAEELRARNAGLKSMEAIAKRYYSDYVAKGIRPRSSVLRPVQLACQNVIIGLAALRHDAAFDGLRVPLYLTCETPHVATHEANRAMAALILCDAFQSGGTMELRFGQHGKEDLVPPALRRFGRAIGVFLGMEDPYCISPREARDLFFAVTPMPEDLRVRCDDLVDRGVISPERLCYTIMASIWSAIELDYIVATSARVETVLRGGAPPELRRHRLAEIETCRAAMMLGMLQRHIDNSDPAARSDRSVRVFEDEPPRALWSVRGDVGAVAIAGIPKGRLPWASRDREAAPLTEDGYLICVPRGLPTPGDCYLARDLQSKHSRAVVALLVPADMVDTVPIELPLMVCPDRVAVLDTDIERRLAMLRVGRL